MLIHWSSFGSIRDKALQNSFHFLYPIPICNCKCCTRLQDKAFCLSNKHFLPWSTAIVMFISERVNSMRRSRENMLGLSKPLHCLNSTLKPIANQITSFLLLRLCRFYKAQPSWFYFFVVVDVVCHFNKIVLYCINWFVAFVVLSSGFPKIASINLNFLKFSEMFYNLLEFLKFLKFSTISKIFWS